ncbi:MAG: hypothetical protein IT294_01205 [Deltaproteobacteria bacterium]|nr:hypothetical protein [Deltaproteobacteria bacterium]
MSLDPQPRARGAQPWVRGLLWDGVWMLSGLWLVPLVLLLSLGSDDPRTGSLDLVYGWLTALFWLGHRIGSTWIAYCTTAYRPLRLAEPVRFVLVPAAIAVACFALLLPADDAFACSRAERVMALAILDYALVTYHFAAQHFGALRLYRARAGGGEGPRRRRLDRIYALAVGGAAVVVAEVVAGTICYVDVWIDPWLDPDRIAAAAATIAAVASIAVAASTFAMLLLEARAERPSLPYALYLTGIGAMVTAAFHVRAPFVFVALWTTQHWIVATGLGALVAEGDRPAATRSRWRAARHAVNRRPWAMLIVLIALSVLLLPVMEVEAVADGGPYYADRIFGALAVALRTSTWAPALVALGFTTGFQHYWLDRAVYRFSDRHVREAARGLLDPPPR